MPKRSLGFAVPPRFAAWTWQANICLSSRTEGRAIRFTHQLPFWRSLDSSQLIPASRMRSTIAIAVRHRSNSSFCCALKSSPGFAGLRIILDGITPTLPVRRERGRVSQPLTPRVESVMPHTSMAPMSIVCPIADGTKVHFFLGRRAVGLHGQGPILGVQMPKNGGISGLMPSIKIQAPSFDKLI
jgi:hypothetical protein